MGVLKFALKFAEVPFAGRTWIFYQTDTLGFKYYQGCHLTTLDGFTNLYQGVVMPRKKHPKKEIEAALQLQYAESKGWRIETGGSHAWGKLYCPFNDGECRHGEHCLASVWSTPKSPNHHAQRIRRIVDHCQRLKQLH